VENEAEVIIVAEGEVGENSEAEAEVGEEEIEVEELLKDSSKKASQ
jgi:hypothetical protein